ncbi:MAG TPA: phosphoenolpyruvate--protein phosphotransferase [Candidatus Cryosericum sp.]|nr:phosphoenolpyruvate--protein phosphotransferase [Candidatus Cryosericum sp.]
MRYAGIAVCAGVALNKSYRLAPLPQFDSELRTAMSTDRARQAYLDARARLESEFRLTASQSGGANAELIEVQLAMLNDESFTEQVESGIASGYAPETAVLRAARSFEQMLSALDDEYMAARADDVRDLGVRLACRMTNQPYPSLTGLTEDCIVVAHDLLPSMLITAEISRIRGIVTENGTRTSHIAILAAGLEIPSIVGCKGAMEIAHGETIFLDGEHGTVENGLSGDALEKCRIRELAYRRERNELMNFAAQKAMTRDGKRISVLANIVNPLALDKVLAYHADGVGLFRTEFLYMNRAALPTEEEQFAVYSDVAKKLNGLPLTIRTMDIGGDKEAECLHLPKEENPFMGYRAVRISLDRRDLILPQLRAILRAAVYGEVWVMFPMIAVKRELEGMLAALEEAKAQLKSEGKPFGASIRVGIMVEVPSAVIMLDQLGKLAEFVSIGSNDLTQYTYAADRMNPRVSYLNDFLDPAVLRMIKRTIDVSAACGIDCSLCGEMAGDALGLAALVALGIHKVSVSPSGILKTKKRLSLLDTAVLCGAGELMINAEDATEVKLHLLKALPEEYALV